MIWRVWTKPEDLPLLFRKFSRREGRDTAGDTCLGLAICKGMTGCRGGCGVRESRGTCGFCALT